MAINKGLWIWFPGDFEIELSAKFMCGRYERDVFIPPFWKQYSAWRNVKFIKKYNEISAESVKIISEGIATIQIDGTYIYGVNGEFMVPAGEHEVVVSVYNDKGLPALKIIGQDFYTDSTWKVTANDHEYVNACCESSLIYGKNTPNNVKLPTMEIVPENVIEYDGGKIYDFGREIFAFVKLTDIDGFGECTVFYGESIDEVKNGKECELISYINVKSGQKKAFTDIAKAFRFVRVKGVNAELTALFEYLPLKNKPVFFCSDELLNKIYEVSLYTLSLNMREFIIDGIKRDRWLWGGDAYQGYLFNYYSFFDKDIVKRTTLALFGKKPFDTYINHIVDYTFFWMIGFCEYLDYTGDVKFIEDNLDKACSLIDYCISKTNKNGLVEGRLFDWVFVDWAENLTKEGELSFEQILYYVALDKFIKVLNRLNRGKLAVKYEKFLKVVKSGLEKFWDEEKGAYIHSFVNGVSDGKVFRYANIFAILYGVCDKSRTEKIVNNVLKNPSVQAITTPYMRFFELSALMQAGEYKFVLDEIRAYWGGMLDEGATTFWEVYDKNEKGAEKYAMYGRKFGKSLCHTWGAGPLYLIGKYVVGIEPLYNDTVMIKPNLGDLKYFSAELPFMDGKISVEMNSTHIKIETENIKAILMIKGKNIEVESGKRCWIEY